MLIQVRFDMTSCPILMKAGGEESYAAILRCFVRYFLLFILDSLKSFDH